MTYVLKIMEYSGKGPADEVFAYTVDKYFLGYAEQWNSSEFLGKLKDRRDALVPTFIGNPGPNLIMETFEGEMISLHQLKSKFKVVLFWGTDCEHCKLAMPDLVKLYNSLDHSTVDFFSVYVGSNREAWEQTITDKGMNWTNLWDPDYITSFRDKYDVYRMFLKNRSSFFEINEVLNSLGSLKSTTSRK